MLPPDSLPLTDSLTTAVYTLSLHDALPICVRLDVPLGCAVEPDMLRDALRRTPVDAVTLVHSETSTGVLQDVSECTRDRKSTRLNSSHITISYAVFCLKKKKKPVHRLARCR